MGTCIVQKYPYRAVRAVGVLETLVCDHYVRSAVAVHICDRYPTPTRVVKDRCLKCAVAVTQQHHPGSRYYVQLAVPVNVCQRDLAELRARAVGDYRLEGAVAIAEQHSQRAERGTVTIAANVRDHQVELSVAVYVADRNGNGVVTARVIGYCSVEGAITFAQQDAH